VVGLDWRWKLQISDGMTGRIVGWSGMGYIDRKAGGIRNRGRDWYRAKFGYPVNGRAWQPRAGIRGARSLAAARFKRTLSCSHEPHGAGRWQQVSLAV
jgi:hypothetical protein